MRYLILFFLSVIGLHRYCATTQRVDPVIASTFILNSYNEPIHLKTLPITFDYANNLPEEFIPQLEKAAFDLNKNLGIEAIRLSGKRVSVDFKNKSPDQKNVIMWIDEAMPEEVITNKEQAMATDQWVGNEIYEADIRFNAYEYNNFKDLDFNTLARHEFAHTLGFCHKSDQSKLMSVSLGEHQIKEPLDLESLTAFQRVYQIQTTRVSSLTEKPLIN